MKVDDREISESPLYQGSDEQIAYQLTTTPWGSNPTNVICKIYYVKDGAFTDYSTSCFGATTATISGDIITTPSVKSLTSGDKYRFEIKFTAGGNIYEPWATIYGQR